MGRYIINRLVRWIPSVLILLLLVYALVFYGAGDPIKLIFLQAPGDVAYDPARVEALQTRSRYAARRAGRRGRHHPDGGSSRTETPGTARHCG